MNYFEEIKKGNLREVVEDLLKPNNTITTLEVKTELRKRFPYFYWIQDEVSREINELVEGKFLAISQDNGIYRTYSKFIAPTKPKSAPISRISRTRALNLMKESKGRFFTATFTKQDGQERTINCQYLKDQAQSELGYIKVKESGKLKKGENPIRNINLQTLKSIKINGDLYKIRS